MIAVIIVLCEPLILFSQIVKRPSIGLIQEQIELRVLQVVERIVVAASTVMRKQRIRTAMLAMKLMPRLQASVCVRNAVVVTKVIVLIARSYPQMRGQTVGRDNNSRSESKASLIANQPIEPSWRK